MSDTDFTNLTPPNTYGDLIHIDHDNAGLDTTARALYDGKGNASPLQLATNKINLQSGFQIGGNAVNSTAAQLNLLNSIANLSILANITGSTGAPSANTVTAILDAALSNTQGTILYRGSSTWAALGTGTNGYYLQTQGAAANPQWAAVSSSGATLGNAYAVTSGKTWCFAY